MIGRVAVALLVTLGLSLAPHGTAAAAPADDIHAVVNEARWANGQAGLIRNPEMDQVAANWAATMAANGTMAHNPDFASQIPGGWTAAAENVAQGHPTGAAMHDGWMGSPGHRANILGDYTDIGIAFLSSGGTTWGVQVFARYPGHSGPAAPALPPPPAPPPAPAPPSEPAPAETVPTATPTPTPSATPPIRREAVSSASPAGTDGIGPGVWGLVAGTAAVLAATLSTVIRRRRLGEP